MVNLSIFAATLLLLLAISNATVYQTTIITDDDGGIENQKGQGQRCRQQIQSQREQFQQCEEYIRRQARQRGGGRQGGPEEVLVLRGVGNQRQEEQQKFQQCCQGLSAMDQECQCQGLSEIVRKQRGERQRGQEQQLQQEMTRIAQRLPEWCQTGEACRRMSVVWF